MVLSFFSIRLPLSLLHIALSTYLIEASQRLKAVAFTLFLPLSSFHVSQLLLLRVSTECCGARDCSGSRIEACLGVSGHACKAADAHTIGTHIGLL